MSKRQLEPFAAEVLEVGATAVGLNSDKFLLGDCLIDGALEIWTSAIVPRYWTPTIAGTSSVNREGTTTRGGTYGLKLSIDGSESLASIEQAIRMSPGGYYTLDVCYRNSAGAKTSKITIKDSGSNKYLMDAGTWRTAPTFITLANSNGAWTQFTLNFNAHGLYTDYTITFANLVALSSDIFIDSIRLIEAHVRGPLPAVEAFGVLEAGQIRFSKNNTPTTTIGQLLEIGQNYLFENFDDIRKFKAIRTGATSGLLTVEYRR
jgi:hypothetical protein